MNENQYDHILHIIHNSLINSNDCCIKLNISNKLPFAFALLTIQRTIIFRINWLLIFIPIIDLFDSQ